MSAGRIVASKYCLLYELGRGGMGEVWAAEHLTLRSRVAVKLIEPKNAQSADAVQRFEREARAAASLRSPNVVQVLDFGVDAGTPYLVMELLTGESLGERLFREGALPAKHVATIMDQIGRAMTRAHSGGIAHRDLKPDNVFLVEESGEFYVKVLDFGIAKSIVPPTVSETHLTGAGAIIGTPQYMSPEQADGRADASCDIWSMAIIAFECTTGKLPFSGESLPALLRAICFDRIEAPSRQASVPPGFDTWFLRAVSRDSRLRFQSAKELVDSLLPLLEVPSAQWLPAPTGRPLEQDLAPTLRLQASPRTPAERRGDARIPSSIPAGLDRRRDLRHAALIYNASRTGALLATRLECQLGQSLLLTLELAGPHHGETLSARVVRVRSRAVDQIWKFDVGVQFDVPLTESLLLELRKRVERADVGSGR